MFEAAGIKLHHMRHSGNGGVICVVEGDAVAGPVAGMVVMASGGFTAVESTELITMEQLVEAMKGAGAVAATVPSARQAIHARGASAGLSFNLMGVSPPPPPRI